jgi:large subunit ribosomal protein L11
MPPAADLIKKALNLEKGSGDAGRESAGVLTRAQVREIAQTKAKDLNATDIEGAEKIIEGTARSMGIEVE